MKEVEITSNYIYETIERLKNIQKFMLENSKDIMNLTDEQVTQWSQCHIGLVKLIYGSEILHYITDDLRRNA